MLVFGHGFELDSISTSLVFGHGFSSPFGGNTGPTAFLAPGYPVLVAWVFFIFGPGTLASAAAVGVLQIAFSVLKIALAIHVARKMFGTRVANFAGLLAAIYPPMVAAPDIFWDAALASALLIGGLALSEATMPLRANHYMPPRAARCHRDDLSMAQALLHAAPSSLSYPAGPPNAERPGAGS